MDGIIYPEVFIKVLNYSGGKSRKGWFSDGPSMPSTWEFVALVAALLALNALTTNIMLPGLPQIGADLGVHDANGPQLVISAYLAGMAVALLPYGPLSDRFGRRKPMLVGLGIYVVASAAAVFVSTFEALLLLRFVQGLGAAGARVISISIIRDRFHGSALAETMSLVMMVFMLVPILAPLLGQGSMLFGGWHATFLFLAFAGALIALWLLLRLPETQPAASRRPFTVGAVVGSFRIVFGNRLSAFYVLASAAMFGALFGFINSAQQIFVDVYGLGEWFPTVFAVMSGMMATSSFVNARLVARVGMAKLAHIALAGFVALSLAWSVVAGAGYSTLASTVFFTTAAMTLFGLISANFNALVMNPLGRIAGAASAIQSFMQTAGGALVGAVIGLAFDGSDRPLAYGFLVTGVVAMVFVVVAEGGKLFRGVDDTPAGDQALRGAQNEL